jgi:hypothetical protein
MNFCKACGGKMISGTIDMPSFIFSFEKEKVYKTSIHHLKTEVCIKCGRFSNVYLPQEDFHHALLQLNVLTHPDLICKSCGGGIVKGILEQVKFRLSYNSDLIEERRSIFIKVINRLVSFFRSNSVEMPLLVDACSKCEEIFINVLINNKDKLLFQNAPVNLMKCELCGGTLMDGTIEPFVFYPSAVSEKGHGFGTDGAEALVCTGCGVLHNFTLNRKNREYLTSEFDSTQNAW